jgi:hypothetical protein
MGDSGARHCGCSAHQASMEWWTSEQESCSFDEGLQRGTDFSPQRHREHGERTQRTNTPTVGALGENGIFSSCYNNDEGWTCSILHGLAVTLSELVDAEYGAGRMPALPAWLNQAL